LQPGLLLLGIFLTIVLQQVSPQKLLTIFRKF
jgi:hypothetical protein